MLIKEYCPKASTSIVVILEGNYDSSFKKIMRLVRIAKKDFPNLKLAPKDFRIECYSGPRRRGLFGIEFEVPVGQVPDGYQRISETERRF